MPGELRAVIDTNVIVSALINAEGVPAAVMRALEEGRFVLVTSRAINAEILEVVRRPRLQKRYGPTWKISTLAQMLEKRARVVVDPPPVAFSPDPNDDKFLSAAVGGKAGYLVTGDIKDLLSLGEYRGVRIVSPRRFLEVLRT